VSNVSLGFNIPTEHEPHSITTSFKLTTTPRFQPRTSFHWLFLGHHILHTGFQSVSSTLDSLATTHPVKREVLISGLAPRRSSAHTHRRDTRVITRILLKRHIFGCLEVSGAGFRYIFDDIVGHWLVMAATRKYAGLPDLV
jgi:hypothetical protein